MDPTLTEIRRQMVGKSVKEIQFFSSGGEIRGMTIILKSGGYVAIGATAYNALKVEI